MFRFIFARKIHRMQFRAFFIFLFVLALSPAFLSAQAGADLVVFNAKVYTMNERFDIAQGFAIKDGRILEMGTTAALLKKYPTAPNFDAQGRAVYPGFIDAHAHFVGYAASLATVDLTGAKSWEECLRRIQQYIVEKSPAPGQWITGHGWDQNDWSVEEFPDRKMLDSLFPQYPIFLRRVDGHAAIANQVALDKAGVKAGKELVGGKVETKNGVLTGILVDNAMGLVGRVIPGPGIAQMRDAMRVAQNNCFAVGLTTVVDCGLNRFDVAMIDTLQKTGALKMRMVVMLSDNEDNYQYYLPRGPYKTARLNVNAFKLYADGALGSRGACLLEPYNDRPAEQGFLLRNKAYYYERAQRLVQSKFQACTHAIGDSANREILRVYASVLKGKNDRRWRIEHAQVVNKHDFDAFGKYSVIPSVQPTHATSDMYWAGARLGTERLRGAYAYAHLLKENGWLPLGTDFPVEDISPFKTFYAAVARQDSAQFPAGGFQMENALTRRQALMGMTIWAAKGSFEEKEKGSLEKGKWADFIVVDHDLMTCPLPEVLQSRVLVTVLQGEFVYRKSEP